MSYTYAQLVKSDKSEKKYMLKFYDENKKRKKTIHFGSAGMDDFTLTKNEDQKNRYLDRHRKNENWSKADTAGALSRWILWNKPTITASYNDYLQKFGLKKY